MSTAEEAPVGLIETIRFARVLARFWERGFTGSFRARSNTRPGVTVTREILFERGRIAWAASDDPEDSIHAHLVNRGLLRRDQWRLAEEKAGSAQVRQTLIDLGFLTARELQEADRERVTAVVLGLFTWREGRYESAAGGLPHGTPNLKIDPRDLVLEGLMSSGDRGLVLDEIGSLDAVLVVRPDDLVRASLSLPVELVGLMGKADGTRTIADICALSSLPDFLISAAFAGLKVLGLARPLEGAPAAAPPAPPTAGPERPALRKRPGRGAGADPVAVEASPRLPLEVAEDFETVPIAATPPGGVHTLARGTATEAGGSADAREMSARAAIPERRLEPEPEAGPAAEEPVIQVAAPVRAGAPAPPIHAARPAIAAPALPAAPPPAAARTAAVAHRFPAVPVPSPEPAPDTFRPVRDSGPRRDEPIVVAADEDEFDREVEVELKPGIPVALGAGAAGARPEARDSLEHAGASDIGDEEIEDVIQILDGSPAGESTPEPGEEAPAFHASGAAEGDPGEDESPEDPESAALEGDGEGVAESADEDAMNDEGEEAPAWVYQPSAEAAAEASRSRLGTWAGIAAAVVGLGAGLIFLFGTGDTESRTSDDLGEIAGAPPADIEAPPAFGSDANPDPQAAPVAPASFAEPAPPPAPAGTGSRATPSTPARSQAPARGAAASPTRPRENRTLASGPSGAIFSSASYREGQRLLGGGDLEAAAGRFATAVEGRTGLYTVQLAIACRPETVSRALGSTRGSSQFFILATQHQGRGCYRLLWGAYASESAALNARAGVPSLFLTDPNPPKVTRL